MAKLTFEDIQKMTDEARLEINKKYGLDDDLDDIDLSEKRRELKKQRIERRKNNRKVVVRNNNKRIGKAEVFSHNVKKVMVATGIAGLVVVSFTAGRVSKETKNVNYVYNVLSENDFREPTYNGVKYTVKNGENVWSIVKKYETDESKIASLVDDIIELNKLYGKTLQPGDEILLVGVPSSMLYLFDYTDNYNLLDPIVEVNNRIDFLNKVKENISSLDEATAYLASIDIVLDNWNSYKYSYILGEESDEFNMILTNLREVCEEASKFGYDYDYYKNCFPISVAHEQERTK